ncbi:restriction endonuclease subunit S [Marinomonas sp. IMCC 4694]|uniref:restriction endonuclease subunit S n=1 Tax=Marinomonas sp. IMCC 4694 TaxID=2605432 RepID=UPI0011E6C471|nr:restriction endonuclease subunit S [Marinomonas sp. IMCC 4694]TYL48424.1 restriction endonuclease subunit S [Marinomonas sp. IMCC 4694]
MGTFRPYSDNKESNIEWVGSVPKHWEVKPLFGVATTESVKNEDGKETNVLSLSYGNIIRRDVEKNFGLLPESFNTYQLVNPDELILRLTDLQNDKRSLRVGHAKERGIITSAYLKLVAKKCELDDRYLYRLLHSYDTTKVFYGMGGGLRQSMKFEEMRRLPIVLPSLEEQQKIANFLDHETAKIDTLIEKQQQLIALLKEKRQAVISHAVTKGLNPNAPMRDSGVEWLGEVPEHWMMPKIAHISRVLNGSTPDKTNLSYWENGTIPWLASGCLNSEIVDEPSQLISESAYQSCSIELIPNNSLLVGMVGQGKTRGTSAILAIDSCINQNMAAIIPSEKVNVRFLYYLFQAMYEDLRELGRGGNQAALNCEIIGSIRISLPKMEEQLAIVEMLDALMVRIRNVDALGLEQIELLQERRTALISAAVTGKIDVREWTPA